MTATAYGWTHQQERARWKPTVDAGQAYCTELVCLLDDRWIAPGARWDLAHDHVNGGYRGPAHAKCNRSEGSKRARRGSQRGRPAQPRRWAL